MNYNPGIHHRRSIRLKGYDYSKPGAYYITVCTQNRICLLGDVKDGKMILNKFGEAIIEKWYNIQKHFQFVRLDEFCTMPNHIHGILFIMESYVGAKHSKKNIIEEPFQNASPLHDRPKGTKSGSLSSIMQNYISITTRKINQIRKTPGEKLWQRNFYERIIRDDNELNKIREYIIYNPQKWDLDRNNPQNWK